MNAAHNPDTELIRSTLVATLRRQRAAYLANPAPEYESRRADLRKLRTFVLQQKDAICEAISADYGHRSHHEILLTEIAPALKDIDHALRHLKRWMRSQRRSVDRMSFGLASNRVIPQPLGVVGVIVPWNFPLYLCFSQLTAILAAGNRTMVKMSENSRHLTRLMLRELEDLFPPEKLRVFEETGGVGVEFSKLPFDHLLFTGSTATGRAVMAAAAANLCPVTLELGGRSPAVVCEDFPLRKAAERILYVKYLNAGQICTSVDHLYLPSRSVKEFVKLAQEIVPRRYPTLETPDYTAIIDDIAYARLLHALDDAKQRGAKLVQLIPGKPFDAKLRKIAPHLILDAPPDCLLMQREIFGPILPVLAYEELDEVVSRVTAGPRPLALYPFSNQRANIDLLITRIMSGGVTVNDALYHIGQHDLPFGGVGDSGMGHYHGYEGFLTFSKLRPVFHQARWSPLALLAPPYGKLTERIIRFLVK